MKRVSLLIILCVLGSSFVWGQKQDSTKAKAKEPTPLLFKDRILLDFYTSFWQGLPADIKAKPFQFGINGAFIFDFPVKKNAPFSFGVGIGVTNFNLYSNGLWDISRDGEYNTVIEPLPESVKYRRNKITFTNVNIPIEFRYRHRCGFKISAGVRVGLTADVHSKYYGDPIISQMGKGLLNKDLFNNYHIPNRTKIPVEITFRTGWKFVSVYGSYMITKMFESGNGPQINPISVGISLCPY
jgi:hypothetical protein